MVGHHGPTYLPKIDSSESQLDCPHGICSPYGATTFQGNHMNQEKFQQDAAPSCNAIEAWHFSRPTFECEVTARSVS